MTRYDNAELRRGGNVSRSRVSLEIESINGDPSRTPEWAGRLLPPNNIGLAVGHTYGLHIPGFMPVRILITGEANPDDSTVTFKGVGAAPTPRTPERVETAQ